MEKVLKQALKDFPGKISISLKQLEPGLLDNLLAQGAECAGEQNKYFQMHDRLFEQQNNLLPIIQDTSSTTNSEKPIRDFLAKQASSLGLKIKDFQSCLDKKTYEIMIQNQTLDALDYGLGQLPSFFINHQFVNGALPYSDFKSMIEKEIKI
jgi:protein-disulfide isomerase